MAGRQLNEKSYPLGTDPNASKAFTNKTLPVYETFQEQTSNTRNLLIYQNDLEQTKKYPLGTRPDYARDNSSMNLNSSSSKSETIINVSRNGSNSKVRTSSYTIKTQATSRGNAKANSNVNIIVR